MTDDSGARSETGANPVGRVHDMRLGEKLAHLEGLFGYRLPADFRKTQLAYLLKISPSQLSRKLAGKEPVKYNELSALVQLFRIGHRLDYEVFLLDLEEFKRVTSAAAAAEAEERPNPREALYRLRTVEEPPRIRISRVGGNRRGAGIGPRVAPDHRPAAFKAYEEIYIDITLPRRGELLVLNERIGHEIYWMRPSSYSLAPVDGAATLRIPDDAGTSSDFTTRPPTDHYRLYAIWLVAGKTWPTSPAVVEGDRLAEATEAELFDLLGHLGRVPTDGRRVMVADYEVK